MVVQLSPMAEPKDYIYGVACLIVSFRYDNFNVVQLSQRLNPKIIFIV